MQSPNVKGAVAELEIELAATRLGIPVLKPVAEHGRYDLGFEIGGRLFRVQCKWGRVIDDGALVVVRVGGNRTTPAGYVRSTYTREEVDLIAVYCGDLDRCFLMPISLAEGRHQVQLRVRPPANGQRAFINLASDFEFDGAVAQLARASVWHTEGRGFESPQLHSPEAHGPSVVGANEFRNRFGWYLERAAAGEEFRVDRRGRPYVRLVPADTQLSFDARPTAARRIRQVCFGRYGESTRAV